MAHGASRAGAMRRWSRILFVTVALAVQQTLCEEFSTVAGTIDEDLTSGEGPNVSPDDLTSSGRHAADHEPDGFENDQTSGEDKQEVGMVRWILTVLLSTALVGGIVRVRQALNRLDSTSIALRSVPEGMRPAECGSCHTTQYISIHGRIFICCSCRSANRMPSNVPHGEPQRLVTSVGPLRRYEFKKGGENFWQEVSQAELPESTAEPLTGNEPLRLHYRGTHCPACGQDTCARLDEFTENVVVAYLPELNQAVEDNEDNVADEENGRAPRSPAIADSVKPAILGRQDLDEVTSNRSARSLDMPQCVVCLDKLGSMVMLPCAHGGVCEECATRIAQNRASGGANCPHCRSNIKLLVKIHHITDGIAHGVEVRIPMARPA